MAGIAGESQTPYLHLNLGNDAVKNRNWAILDRRLYDLARGLISNIPAGGDLTGFYPDPIIKDGAMTPAKIAPGGDPGETLTIDASGNLIWINSTAATTISPIPPTNPLPGQLWWRDDPDGTLFVYYQDVDSAQWVPATPAASASGPSFWTDNGTALVPVPPSRNLLLAGNVLFQNNSAGPSGPNSILWDSGAGDWSSPVVVWGTYGVLSLDAPTSARVDIAGQMVAQFDAGGLIASGSIVLAQEMRGSPQNGAIQYVSGHIQGRLAGAWVNLDGASGAAGGDLSGTYPNPTLAPAQKNLWQVVGTALTPVDVTKGLELLGVTAGIRGRMDVMSNGDTSTHVNNFKAPDYPTVSSWATILSSANDKFTVIRRAANAAAGASTTLLSLDATGKLTIGADPTGVLDVATKQYVDAHSGGGGAPTGAAGGDLSGTYPNPTVKSTAGNLQVNSNLNVLGTTTLFGTVLTNAVQISGTATMAGVTATSLSVSGATTISGQLNAPGNIVIRPTSGNAALSLDNGGISATPASGATLGVINQFVGAPLCAQAFFFATEQWVIGTAQGAGFSLRMTQTGSTSSRERLRFDGTGCYIRGNDGTTHATLDATGNLTLPTNSGVSMGAGTIKAILTPSATGAFYATVNNPWAPQDSTKSSWAHYLDLAPDAFVVSRRAANAGAGVTTNLLTLDATGQLTLGGAAENCHTFGSRTAKGRLVSLAGQDWIGLTANDRWTGSAWAQDDVTKSSWHIVEYLATDQLLIEHRAAANGATAQTLLLDASGNLTIIGPNATKSAGTVWINPSDIRIKKDIFDYCLGLEEIVALRPVRFAFNGYADTRDGEVGFGYLADEVATVMPECVSTRKVRLHDDTEIDLQFLDTSNISLAVVNAIKELARRVEALEAR